MVRVLPALALSSLAACSDYELKAQETPARPGDGESGIPEDTGPDVEPIECDTTGPEAGTVTVDESCVDEPDIGTFNPVVEWRWEDNPTHPGYHQIMSAPVVANLTDDNGDGVVDGSDVPDVVFTVFSEATGYTNPGGIVAISGADGSTLWSKLDLGGGVQPYGVAGVGVADVDGTGPSVFVSTTAGLARLNAAGELQWATPLPDTARRGAYIWPAFGDLEGDGLAEIAAGAAVLNADGTLRWEGAAGTGWSMSFFADLDQDGQQELVAGSTVYAADGTPWWTEGEDGLSAVADLDADGDPEVVTVVRNVGLTARHHDGTLLWDSPLDDLGGGPPTIADFDGDGEPEIGLASEYWYRVIEGSDGSELWRASVQDRSSKVTGSSVFDFEGDGAAEVVYADEQTLWVFDGGTGAVELAVSEHSSGTLYEYPLVVDVDNDGSAEIVAISNDYSAYRDSHGVAIIGDADSSWEPGRPIWNQHAYSISNIGDDASVPPVPIPNWRNWNSFRAGNSESRVGLDLPDLRAGDPEVCTDECEATGEALVWLRFTNSGLSEAVAVPVAIYALDGATRTLVETTTLTRIGSGEEAWLGPLRLDSSAFGSSGAVVVADDDGTGAGRIEECQEANNLTVIPRFPCDD